MSFPNCLDKFGSRSIISPHHAHVAADAATLGPLPETVIVLFSKKHLKAVSQRYRLRKSPTPRLPHLLLDSDGRLGVIVSGIGAPAGVMTVEVLMALGIRQLILLGAAGSLQEGLPPGSLVTCTGAIRDEGTSHHYARDDGHPARPDRRLTMRLQRALASASPSGVSGLSWTTDAPYRETRAELHEYSRRGILTVEMEASAVMTVARYRGAMVAAGFFITDRLTRNGWQSEMTSSAVSRRFEEMTELVIAPYLR